MALNWLTALKLVPWGTLLSQAPSVADAANRLLAESKRRREGRGPADEVQSLQQKVAALEERDVANAAVIKQLADEVAQLALASQIAAARVRILAVVAAAGLALGIASLVLALAS